MPPKKKEPKGPSAKTLQKEKAKVVEDKTFGLKNKNKSKAVQQYVKQVTTQVMDGGTKKGGERAQLEAAHKQKEEKKKSAAQKALLQSLFKSVVEVQVNAETGEVDKKKTLCAHFKAGVCEKGKKCKYSHDLTLGDARELALDLYSDPRAKTSGVPDTIITCRDFLEAVEKELYGFNWVCPTAGDRCQYRHMLPPGYVLNRDKVAQGAEDSEEELTLEEKIEEERAALPADGLTPVTYETFMKWKADKAERKQQELEQKMLAEEAKGKRDRSQMQFMSGRALFQFNPDLFVDDDAAAADIDEDFDSDEEVKGGAAQQEESKAGFGVVDEDDEEEKKEESDEETKVDEEQQEEEKKIDDPPVQVDQDLFAGEDAAMDEDVDFD